MIRSFCFLFFLLVVTCSFSQQQKELSQSKHIYVQGNSVLAGNNILGHHSSKPMMNDDVPNDAVKMKYIDVDNDSQTFSSSEAAIKNVPENAKVVYAALYWTGLYPYEKGKLTTRGGKAEFISRGDRDDNVSEILLKLPESGYLQVKGAVLRDGFYEKELSETAPYVCKADVTQLLKDQKSMNGIYTVANVKAAEGRVSGGGSAGWVLYVVYEDENESLKYFTSYDGLVEINKGEVDLDFSGFKGSEEGEIRATLGIGALEGDRKIPTDQLLLFSDKNGKFVPMSNALRDEKNFFISSITFGNNIYEDRNPNSSNTLGFDLLTLEVPNEQHDFFDKTTTETTLRFQTRTDRFYLFFVSFAIEMDKKYLDELLVNSDSTEEITSEGRLEKTHVASKVPAETKTETRSATENEGESKNFNSDSKLHLLNGKRKARYPNLSESEAELIKEDIQSQENRIIPGLPAGYYLVTNVFAMPDNARRWREFLIKKDFVPATFHNPENNWEYIYTDAFDNLEEGFEVWKQHQDKEYFVGLWLMKVNMEATDIAEAR